MKTNRNIKISKNDYFAKILDRDYIREMKKKISSHYSNLHENYAYFQDENIFRSKDSNTFNEYIKYIRDLRKKEENFKHSITLKTIKSESKEKKILTAEKLRIFFEKQHKNIPSSLFDFIHPYEYLFTNKNLKLNRAKSSKRSKILLSNRHNSENIFITTMTDRSKTINTINSNKFLRSKILNKQISKNIKDNKSFNKYNTLNPEDEIITKNKRNFFIRKSLNEKDNNKNLENMNLNSITVKRPITARINNHKRLKLKKDKLLNVINTNTNSNSDFIQISQIHDRSKSVNNSSFLNKKLKKRVKSTINTNNNQNKTDVKKNIICRNVLSAHFSRRKNNKNKQQLYTEILNINSKLDEIKNNIINILPEKNSIPVEKENTNKIIMKILSEREKYACRSSRELYNHLKEKHHIKNLTNHYMIQKSNFNGVIKQKFLESLQKVDENEKRENNIKNMIYKHNYEVRKEVNKLTEKDFAKTLNSFNKNNRKIKGMIARTKNYLIQAINK